MQTRELIIERYEYLTWLLDSCYYDDEYQSVLTLIGGK